MELREITINSTKILFDAEATYGHRTDHNEPCDCQNCRNYYKIVEGNPELVAFLRDFGVDFYHTDEVMSWDLGKDKDSQIHHNAYYGVFGRIEGEEVTIRRFGVKIAFEKGAIVPNDRDGEYFWIRIEEDFPYILEEERDLGVPYEGRKETIKDRLKTAGITLLLILLIPFLLIYLIFKVLWMPITYIKYKRSLYQRGFPCRFSFYWNEHRDSVPYAAILENDLPVSYVKHQGEYDWLGHFVYKDTLLCFSEPIIYDAEKQIWYSWLDADREEKTRERESVDYLTVEATADELLQGLKNAHTEHSCYRVVFFYSRKTAEGSYVDGALEAMRQMDNFVIYEKGELAKAIREFIENYE